MTKTKLIVTTDVGTFTRTTTRTYSHIVVAEGVRAELLEAERIDAIARETREAEKMEAYQAGTQRDIRPQCVEFDTKFYNEHRANGDYGKWAIEYRQSVDAYVAQGVITEDEGMGFGILAWCGRLDLAAKIATASGRLPYYNSAARYRNVRVYRVVDGTEVRHLRKGS